MELFETIHARRSIRRFQRLPVEDEKLARIFEAVNRAPSAGNLQAYRLVVVREASVRQALARAASHQLVKEERQLLEKDFPKERLMTALKNNILLHRENVVITPHIAFDSREALQRILDTTVANILGFLNGSPINLVTLPSR